MDSKMIRKAIEEVNMADNKLVQYKNELLLAAINACNVEEVDTILRNCGNLSREVVNAHCGLMDATALHLAAAKGKKAGQLVKQLLAYGAKVDIPDNAGGIPLHTAALIGSVEAVEALIKAGANVNKIFNRNTWAKEEYLNCNKQYKDPPTWKPPCSDCRGRTPLHLAVLSGNAECVQLLLQARANINAEDDIGMTPLLLAGTGIVPGNKREIQRYEEVVELLVQSGADVNACSKATWTTAMHQAAELCSLRAMKCLLDADAVLTNMEGTGMAMTTVLHVAASKDCPILVDLLLRRGAQILVNSKDEKGYTPLHKAAQAGARDCLALLLKYGGDLAAETTRNLSVMDMIFDHIPHPVNFLTDILDKTITTNNASINSSDFKVTLDFSILCPYGTERQMAVVMALMDSGNDFQQKQIVRHPLLKAFLRFKWHQLRIFFYLLMVLHFCFMVSLSAFCYLKIDAIKNEKSNDSFPLVVAHKVMMVTAVMWSLYFIIQFIMLPRHHVVQFETWIHLLGIIFSLTVAIGHSMKNNSWFIHVMCFAVLNVWIEFMSLIGRIPRWGHYSLMFYQVLWNVIKVLMIFSSLIIGFTLSFMLQFDDFGNIWHSFIKTIVMMTGEFGYEELFKRNNTMNANNNNMSYESGLEGTSKFIFLLFVILASIVLMNLMVGLAVNDIQELQAQGHIQRLLKQAEFVIQLEKLTTHNLVPRCLRRMFQNRKSVKTKFEITPNAFSPIKSKVSYYLLERIVHTAIHNLRKTNKYVSEYPSNGKDTSKTKLMREYSNVSDISPSSSNISMGSINFIALMHQLQLDMIEIKEALNEQKLNLSHCEEDDEALNRGLRKKRWTRRFNDSEDSTGMSIRRLCKVNSKTPNFII